MYIQKASSCRKSIRQTKDYKKKKKKMLITKERITRGESPNPKPFKKRTTKRSKQLIIRFVHVLKSPLISLPPNTPHCISKIR